TTVKTTSRDFIIPPIQRIGFAIAERLHGTHLRLLESRYDGSVVGFYQDQIVPYLVQMSMRQESLAAYRHRVVSGAAGRILEIGIGSGLNLQHYGEKAQDV